EKAHVTARLTGAHVTVAGQVDGQIFCEGRVEIRPTGRVTGEINAGALIVQEGAYFEGNSRMASGGSATHSTTTAASAATSTANASNSGARARPAPPPPRQIRPPAASAPFASSSTPFSVFADRAWLSQGQWVAPAGGR